MPLTIDQERESAQLMFVARHYLSLVAKACKSSTTTMGATKVAFAGSRTLTKPERRETIVNAHLTSAAIRLASVDKILSKAGCARLSSPLSEQFHVMLRDAVGHEEPDMWSTKTCGGLNTYRERQERIENTTHADAYSTLRSIAHAVETFLKTRHGIVRQQ
jgi:hypothetical protein